MDVKCNSIGSVPSHSNAPVTECSMCGAAKPHDVRSCEPCPWNKQAKCVPVPEAEVYIVDIENTPNRRLGM
jgi:hypothetical protein